MKRLFIIIILGLVIFGCGDSGRVTPKGQKRINPHKPMAWGKKHIIYVFADDDVWNKSEPQLRRTLERYVFTTENEKYFEVKRAPFDALEQFYKYNNLIFMGDMSSQGQVTEYIKSVTSDNIKAQVEKNLVGIYPVENLWANDQYVLFMLGTTEENLLKVNYLHLNQTFDLFKIKLLERVSRQIYMSEQHPSNDFAKFPWTLDLPKRYVPYKTDPANNYHSYIARNKEKPDRYVAVYYQDSAEDIVDKTLLKEKRAELAWKYFDEDEYVEDNIRTEKFEIAGFKGWKISGMWMNKKYTAGGAFQSYAFYDEISKKVYLIDNSVYYPQGYKLNALIELEIISNSLKIKQ